MKTISTYPVRFWIFQFFSSLCEHFFSSESSTKHFRAIKRGKLFITTATSGCNCTCFVFQSFYALELQPEDRSQRINHSHSFASQINHFCCCVIFHFSCFSKFHVQSFKFLNILRFWLLFCFLFVFFSQKLFGRSDLHIKSILKFSSQSTFQSFTQTPTSALLFSSMKFNFLVFPIAPNCISRWKQLFECNVSFAS